MFDDQPTNKQTNVPPNLPLGETEDIFAGTMDDASDVPTSAVTSSSVPPEADSLESAPPSALGAGILRPKQAPGPSAPIEASVPRPSEPTTSPGLSATSSSVAPRSQQPPERPPYAPQPPQYASMGVDPATGENAETTGIIKEPIGSKKVIFFIIIIVLFFVLAVGGAWIYFSFIADKDTTGSFEPDTTVPIKDTTPETPPPAVVPTTTDTTDENIIFGDTIPDTDSDGLDDVREEDIGTDSLNWDTDGDELSDGDEVIIWKTKPLDPDTDGDSFADGIEIRNGYNPLGNGKLFEPPTSATTTNKTDSTATPTIGTATTSTTGI